MMNSLKKGSARRGRLRPLEQRRKGTIAAAEVTEWVRMTMDD
jgi:hypothetical protein